ncbi:uncharacterized protein N7503_006958 [Penicillium pulvis]|uniref:uncharacterized protein n=1 Tax=Penicillium pulvis TaxID=1562058 RepID=UPI002548F6C6|nr:uncharacterized protein N7503_006958 [Penicillium pulvis]KAJ5797662.1 hypothetical protein N7503_006958 [Penicillium pulvis]
MADNTPATQVKLLTKLPAPPSAPPSLASGIVSLFADDNWDSQRLDLNMNDFSSGDRPTIKRSALDNATYVAFNLPIGTVVTLMDNVQPVPAGKLAADLSGCGRCVDLVGTGNTESVDLQSVNMNDCVSSFSFREIDLNMGAIELFQDADFNGGRNTIFLSEWDSGVTYSIGDWWITDAVSSVRWKSLNDRQAAVLADNSDGSGDNFPNIKGWGNNKESADLGDDASFNDQMSSFRWDGIVPALEIIAPFNIVLSGGSTSSGLTAAVSGTNNSTLAQPVTVTLTKTDAQTLTVTTMDEQVTGLKSTQTMEETAGDPGIASASTTWAIELSYSYTESTTKETSETTTLDLSIAQTVNAPPQCSYTATLIVQIGKIPPKVYTTTAQRWYKVPVTGGVMDPLNNNWYQRVEPVSVSVTGSLASSTTVNIVSTPLTS